MTNLQEYKLSLFERCEAGDITEDERNLLLEAVSEEEVEEVSTDVEESEEIDEEDTELEEAVAEYLDTIEERFNEGTLTEEEVDILLESLAGKVKAAKKAVVNAPKNAKKSVHDKFNNIMDDKAKPFRDESEKYGKEMKNHTEDLETARDIKASYKQDMEAAKKNKKLSAKDKVETYSKIFDNIRDADHMEKHAEQKVNDAAAKKQKADDVVSEYETSKNKSTGYKGGYLAGRAIRKGADKVASNISSAKAALKKKVTGK